MMIKYCKNGTSLWPLWQNSGISICLFDTLKPMILFLLSFIKMLHQNYVAFKYKKRWRNSRKEHFEKTGLIQSGDHIEDESEVVVLDEKYEEEKKCFKNFPFPDLPLPFLYAFQLMLHSVHVILPLIKIIAKMIINNSEIAGVDILNALLLTCTWVLGLTVLKRERHCYYLSKFKRHSFMMLAFWTVALLFDLLVFVSWNNKFWFLKDHDDGIKCVDFITFCFQLSANFMLFILGLHGPGLYKVVKEKNKTEQKSTLKDLWEQTKRLWPFIWPNNNWLRFRVMACFILLVAGRVVNVFIPLQNKKIIDYLTNKNNKSNPWNLILFYMGLSLLQGGGGIGSGLIANIRSFIWIKVQQYTSRSVQTQLFEHLHNLSLRWHLHRKTGEVIRMVDRGSTSIENLLSYILFQIFPTIADIIVALVFFGTAFNGWFALIVFLTMFAYIGATIGVTEWRTKYRREMNDRENATKAVAVDSLLNFETVKYYNNEHFEVSRYSGKINDYQDAQWMTLMSLSILNTSQNIIITLGLLSGMLYCAKLVVEGHLTVGDFVLFLSYVKQLYAPLNFFGTYYRLIQAAFIDMENMFDLLGEKVEIKDLHDAPELRLNHGLVEFKNVHFAYDERKPILKGISFTVLPGQTVALVGPSGSGKSTIIRLLFRFYDVTGGAVLLDGQDLKEVTQKSLRQVIGVVPQDTVLFNETIKYNIAYGNVGSDDKQVEEAAASADIHVKIVTFPEEYETVVGERGLKLSGGEKQRVAIARTMLKAPDIVLLDEATSALDTQTERNIQASLNRVCANKTTIVVAHRLSTVIGADQILVLKDGVIIEHGRHHELLDFNGLYALMWNQQLRDENNKSDELKKED